MVPIARISMILLLMVVFFSTLVNVAQASLVKKTLTYKEGGEQFKSYLVFDDSYSGKRPGVLVFPEWWGLNDYAKMRADQLAALGYVALAVDIYGDAKNTTDPKVAGQWAGNFRSHPELMRTNSQAAYRMLAEQPLVDVHNLAAVGYCFGGTVVLSLAYSGADLKGAVTFHGGLIVPDAGDLKRLKAKLLILHGAIDPTMKPETIQAFRAALESAHKDYQMVYYSGAVHAFTNPNSGSDPTKGVAYNAIAAQRAWEAMRTFLKEVFAGTGTSAKQ